MKAKLLRIKESEIETEIRTMLTEGKTYEEVEKHSSYIISVIGDDGLSVSIDISGDCQYCDWVIVEE